VTLPIAKSRENTDIDIMTYILGPSSGLQLLGPKYQGDSMVQPDPTICKGWVYPPSFPKSTNADFISQGKNNAAAASIF